MTDDRPGRGSVMEKTSSTEELGAGGLAGVTVLRIIAALAVPIISFVVLWLTFEFLRDAEANRLVLAIVAIVVGVAGVFALYWGMDLVVNLLPNRFQESVRPYVFVGPALVILTVFLVYPAINTTVISFMDAQSKEFVGLDNYKFVFTDEGMLRSIRNTVGWIIVVPLFSVGIGWFLPRWWTASAAARPWPSR